MKDSITIAFTLIANQTGHKKDATLIEIGKIEGVQKIIKGELDPKIFHDSYLAFVNQTADLQKIADDIEAVNGVQSVEPLIQRLAITS